MAEANRTPWEYHGIAADSEVELMRGLNLAGTEGWELVSICSRTGKREPAWAAFLKRPVAGQPPPNPAKTSDTARMKAAEAETKKQPPSDDTGFDVNPSGPESSGEGFDLQL